MSETFSEAPGMGIERHNLPAPFGRVECWARAGRLWRIVLSPEPLQAIPSRGLLSRMAGDLPAQIERYFEDPHQDFRWDIPLGGTAFQNRVWLALKSIPPGEVRTYGELARAIGSGPRAVAGACRANLWPLLIPCHRVVSAAGEGGYFGHTQGPYLGIKRWLLAHEGRR